MLKRLYTDYRQALLIAAAISLPIKLALAYFFVIPLIALWILGAEKEKLSVLITKHPSLFPFFCFILVAIVSALFGIDFLKSLRALISLVFTAALIIIVASNKDIQKTFQILLALLVGQAIAAIHSIFEQSYPEILTFRLISKVTESGQIALTLIAGIGLILHLHSINSAVFKSYSRRYLGYLFGIINFLLIILCSFHQQFNFQAPQLKLILISLITSLGISGFLMYAALKKAPDSWSFVLTLCTTTLVPLIGSALVINLKRGPWAGITVALLLHFFIFHRKLILPFILSLLLVFFSLEPVRIRLSQSATDFFMRGGRNVMWQIGSELSLRYPLGIGFANSRFLRNFSAEIPEYLKHFHSNLINITVETGWIGLGVFIWWLYSILRLAFSRSENATVFLLSATIGCALIAWQIAGLVEYNFGDTEVWLIVLILLGCMYSLRANSEQAFSSEPKEQFG